jgi:hypothetical protein
VSPLPWDSGGNARFTSPVQRSRAVSATNDINTGLGLFTDIKQKNTSAQAYSIFQPNQEDGGDTVEYAAKVLGGESQLANWVRVAGVDIHWIAEAMAILKIN